ncbi:hypothetical protein GALL_484050 [mine drainage metagenome]|uniref:Uncharacterized protein n=1 Tax=mine drainage metagenome TaxID=410659 RepID=A0A1J5Q293_9ZZZZ
MEKLADDAAHETNGQEHRHDRHGGGKHCQTDLTGAVHGSVKRVFAHLHVAHNVFAHHNGIVNEQADTQAQGHHGDHVDGETQQVHEKEGADQGNRQGQAGDDGRAPGIEKQKHDQHGQQRPFEQGFAHVGH